MSERIVSPGVFTRERDLSFLPQGISEIGAAIIGPTPKGPAFTPTQVSNFQEFEEIFGNLNPKFYVPYTVEAYLRSAGTVTVVRVLGIGGYKADSIELRLQATSSIAANVTRSLAVLAPSLGGSSTGDLSKSILSGSSVGLSGSFTLIASGSDITSATYSLSFNTGSANYIENVISKDPLSTKSGNNTSPVYVYKIYKEAIHRTFGGDLKEVSTNINVKRDSMLIDTSRNGKNHKAPRNDIGIPNETQKESLGFRNKDKTNITRINPIHAFFTNKSILPLKYSDSSDHDDILIPEGKDFFFSSI